MKRQNLFSLLIVLLIAAVFWSQSRVPALDEKAQTGDRTNLSAIAVDIIWPTDVAQSYPERVLKTAVNWGYTNWKGMTFGLLFAAAFLSLLKGLPRPSFGTNRFVRSLGGLFFGVPLGVCVNCATPIAHGIFRSGARLEYSLAMLLSSPTLNVIVVTMAFSLLPFHLALLKLAASVAMIALLLPVLIRLSEATIKSPAKDTGLSPGSQMGARSASTGLCPLPQTDPTWGQAITHSLTSFWSNLGFIVRQTLPLMIVAGLLGSALIEALPTGDLTNLALGPTSVTLLALVGTFLPVPIAFDVLATNALILGGLPIGLAATLLFSLGIFSIYPALIIARNISAKLSGLIFVSVVVAATAVGYAADRIDTRIKLSAVTAVSDELAVPASLDLIETAAAECSTFAAEGDKNVCLAEFLRSDLFELIESSDCDALRSRESRSSAYSFCQSLASLHKTKASAVYGGRLASCEGLISTDAIAVCIHRYIERHALTITSIQICDELSSQGAVRICRDSVIEERLIMGTAEACDIGLRREDAISCFDRLNAKIAAEFESIETCGMLTSHNAQEICQRNVLAKRIFAIGNHEVCGQVINPALKSECEQMVLSHRALKEGKPFLCGELAHRHPQLLCRLNIIIEDVRKQNQARLFADFDKLGVDPDRTARVNFTPDPAITEIKLRLGWHSYYRSDDVSIEFIEHNLRTPKPGPVFERLGATAVGLDSTWRYHLSDQQEPFKMGKGIASGDVNNDGWPDLAFAVENGAEIYINNGRGGFLKHSLLSPAGASPNSFVVTFVDIDNDGWQDIFLSTYGGGNFSFRNQGGTFSPNARPLPRSDGQIVTMAAGFADLDRDGDLDGVMGNWSYGTEKNFIPVFSGNIWYINDAGSFSPTIPSEMAGDTLSVLLSDVNDDTFIDLFVANDRQYPDAVYLANDSHGFDQIEDAVSYFPRTSLNNMSYDSADFNNDLALDIFSADMSFGPGDRTDYCDAMPVADDQARCRWLLKGLEAVERLDTDWCARLDGARRQECFVAMAIQLAKIDNDEGMCDRVPSSLPGKKILCLNLARKITNVEQPSFAGTIPQVQSNKLLLNTPGGGFVDATDEMGVSSSYWSWNAKAADLDNDGWQDIYVGNGFDFGAGGRDLHSNVFYHNDGGVRFTRAEDAFGLSSHNNTPSYTYLDIDIDGDLDIIETNVMASPSAYINRGTSGNSVSFVLRDQVGNRFCIGCKLYIEYEGGKKKQMRELKLSGGFLSFDDPVMHFGLGDEETIDRIAVVWSTGERTTVDHKLKANRRYRVSRGAAE